MGARLYTLLDCWNSYAQVGKGMLRAFEAHGVSDGVFPLDRTPDFDEPPYPGASAMHGVFYGPPPLLPVLSNSNHQRRWGMLAPNSDRVPPDILRMFEHSCTDLLVPSQWAWTVMAGRTKLPVAVAPHGVAPEFQAIPRLATEQRNEYANGKFRVVHLTTSDRQRKGTLELVRAWRMAQTRAPRGLPAEASLCLVMDAQARVVLGEQMLDAGELLPESVHIEHRLGCGRGVAPELMAVLYQQHHLVCQPSRGEGFGCVPVEARACGVPVLATACTGHAEHLLTATAADGVVLVPTGSPAAIDDFPGALAPSLAVEDVYEALCFAYRNWLDLSAAAERSAAAFRERWQWERKLEPLCRLLQETV